MKNTLESMHKNDATAEKVQFKYYAYDIYVEEYVRYWDEDRDKFKYTTEASTYQYINQNLVKEEEIEKEFIEASKEKVTLFKLSEPHEVTSSSFDTKEAFTKSDTPFNGSFISKDDIIKKLKNGERNIKYIYNPSDEMCLVSLEHDVDNFKLIGNKLSEEIQLYVVSKDPSKLEFIRKPTNKVQVAAIKKDPTVIEHLKYYDSYPTEEAQFIAVKADITNMKLISHSTEKVQLYVIESDITNIKYIYTPTEKVQLLALEADMDNFKLIQNATEKVKLLALKYDSTNIQYINKKTDEMQMIAVKADIANVKYLDLPCEEVQLLLLEADINNFKLLRSLSSKAKRLIVEADSTNIQYLHFSSNPQLNFLDDDIQLLALKADVNNFKLIKNPTEKAKMFYENNKSIGK